MMNTLTIKFKGKVLCERRYRPEFASIWSGLPIVDGTDQVKSEWVSANSVYTCKKKPWIILLSYQIIWIYYRKLEDKIRTDRYILWESDEAIISRIVEQIYA